MRSLQNRLQSQSRLQTWWCVCRRRRLLSREADALLAGHYLDQLSRHRGRAPAWTVLNAVAHRPLSELRHLAATPPVQATGLLTRADASAWLAAQLCSIVGGDERRLAAVQHELLVPLELALLDPGRGGTPPTVADVLVTVRSFLSPSSS